MSDMPSQLQPEENTTPLLHTENVRLAENLNGYYARPMREGPFPAVMVFMEAFGLNPFIRAVCERLASIGYIALAPDFYHGKTYDYDNMDGAIGHLKTLDDATIMQETGKAVAFLSSQKDFDVGCLGVMGFCMGGRLAFLAHAGLGEQSKAAVCFYGAGIAPEHDPAGRPPLLDRIKDMRGPLLLLYGADDTSIKADEHGRIAQSLSEASKHYILSVFKNAGHGFFSDRRKSYTPRAADEAWSMTLEFLKRYLGA